MYIHRPPLELNEDYFFVQKKKTQSYFSLADDGGPFNHPLTKSPTQLTLNRPIEALLRYEP
jgi:hypothetical protein